MPSDQNILRRQQGNDLSLSQKGSLRVEFIESSLDGKFFLVGRCRLVVEMGTREAEQLCLLRDWQLGFVSPFE